MAFQIMSWKCNPHGEIGPKLISMLQGISKQKSRRFLNNINMAVSRTKNIENSHNCVNFTIFLDHSISDQWNHSGRCHSFPRQSCQIISILNCKRRAFFHLLKSLISLSYRDFNFGSQNWCNFTFHREFFFQLIVTFTKIE